MKILWLVLIGLLWCGTAQAQLWSTILDPTRAIDWTTAGVPGGIPTRTTICATLSTLGGSTDNKTQIQNALNACPANQVVKLNAGTYRVNSTITIPSNRVLRGSGNLNTILTVFGSGSAIQFGSETSPTNGSVRTITSGATKGSTTITFTGGSITTGQLLRIAQSNVGVAYITNPGDGALCNWCDGDLPTNADYDSGQTVLVTTGGSSSATITPPLVIDFTSAPRAWPYSVGCDNAGLEDLQLYANNTGKLMMISLSGTIRSWVLGVEDNFADESHVQIHWSAMNELRNNYFHDGFDHRPGNEDNEVKLGHNASHTLVINNINSRQHTSIMAEWGASGNVIAYNFITGNYHTDSAGAHAPTWFVAHGSYHGAHPLMNLWEGNVMGKFQDDSLWGSSSHTTFFRNLFTGTNLSIPPYSARGTLQLGSPVNQTGPREGIVLNWTVAYTNNVGNIVGSTSLLAASPSQYMLYPAGSVFGTACWQVAWPYDNGQTPGPSLTESTMFKHGLYNCLTGAFTWDAGHPDHTLPASFFLSAKPSWWGSLPWPPIGPDVTGGTAGGVNGHANKIPAQACFDSAPLDATNRPAVDLTTCYAGGDVSPPAAPTGVTVSRLMFGGEK